MPPAGGRWRVTLTLETERPAEKIARPAPLDLWLSGILALLGIAATVATAVWL